MGQKVSPTGFRLGITEDWRSRWYADKDYASNLENDLAIRKFVDDLLFRMSVTIALSHADERDARAKRFGKVRIGRGGRTVMAHLEHVDRADAALRERRLQRCGINVAGEQGRLIDDAITVDVRIEHSAQAVLIASVVRKRVRPDDASLKSSDGHAVSDACADDLGSRGARLGYELSTRIIVAGEHVVRDDDAVDDNRPLKRVERAAMVVIGVGDEHGVEVTHVFAGKRCEKFAVLVSRVDEHASTFASHQERIALPHIEHDDFRRTRRTEGDDDGDRDAERAECPQTFQARFRPGDIERRGKRSRESERRDGRPRHGNARKRYARQQGHERAQTSRRSGRQRERKRERRATSERQQARREPQAADNREERRRRDVGERRDEGQLREHRA